MARATPLGPDDRRATILAATESLIVAQGGSVSTRAIAKAAGIAEGTIFRVFPTKEAIVDAIFADAFDRTAFLEELAGLSTADPLETRMERVVAILQRRSRRIMALFGALGFRRPPGMDDHKPKAKPHSDPALAGIAALLEPDRDRLRVAPLEAARLMQSLGIALSMPMLSNHPDYAPETIVDLILNGVAHRDTGAADGGTEPC
jgi:AcrR family transcriptional regulator